MESRQVRCDPMSKEKDVFKLEIQTRCKHIEYLIELESDIAQQLAEWQKGIAAIVNKNLEEIYDILGI